MLCRHALVEPTHTQTTYLVLKQQGWTRHGAPIQSVGERNGIPLSDEAPDISDIISMFEWHVEEIILTAIIPPETLTESFARFLDDIDAPPRPFPPHDVLGEIVLMRVGAEEKEAIESGEKTHFIGAARLLLERQTNLRAVFVDLGVIGPYRLRNLLPLIARHNHTLVLPEDIPPEEQTMAFSTRTTLRTDGVHLVVDPAKAYFNPRLGGQRRQFTERLHEFSTELARPLRIADPYCGVGPMLRSILHHSVPISALLGVDLNPAAIELACLNMPLEPSAVIEIIEGHAKEIASIEGWCGTMDVVFCNLPRSGTAAFLDVQPLLCPGALMLGWIHAPADSAESLIRSLRGELECENVMCRETRSYSSTVSTYVVEVRV